MADILKDTLSGFYGSRWLDLEVAGIQPSMKLVKDLWVLLLAQFAWLLANGW